MQLNRNDLSPSPRFHVLKGTVASVTKQRQNDDYRRPVGGHGHRLLAPLESVLEPTAAGSFPGSYPLRQQDLEQDLDLERERERERELEREREREPGLGLELEWLRGLRRAPGPAQMNRRPCNLPTR